MILFMVFAPLLLPFFLFSLQSRGLPDNLGWWKSFGAGIWTFLLSLLFSWLLGFPSSMVPSFVRDWLFWWMQDFVPLALALGGGLLIFRSGFFSRFLTEKTIFPFAMGIYMPTGIENIIRYFHEQDLFVLFALPVTELLCLLICTMLVVRVFQLSGVYRIVPIIAILPALSLPALVPALYYAFYEYMAAAVFAVLTLVTAYLTHREGVLGR